MARNSDVFDFAARNKVVIDCYSDKYGRNVRVAYTDSDGAEHGYIMPLGSRSFGFVVEELLQTVMLNAAPKGPQPWQSTPPPNEVIVEVQHEGQVIEVMAYYGRDGSRPHWRTVDGCVCWGADAFTLWRYKA